MKKFFTLAMMMVMTITANAMSFKTAKNEALFLSDKMAYELNLTDAQYEDVYEINLDYLMSVNGRNDAYGTWWKRRNNDLKYVLTVYQYEKYLKLNHFYRPLAWKNGDWTFNVYTHYSNKNHFFKGHPKGFASYKGGNNKKSDRHYADRKVLDKPAPTPTMKHGDYKMNTKPTRQFAQNTTANSKGKKTSHFK
jgi:hypothetical protein